MEIKLIFSIEEVGALVILTTKQPALRKKIQTESLKQVLEAQGGDN